MNNEYLDYALDDMNKCVSPCTDISVTCGETREKVVNIDWLVKNLPGMNYVKNRALNYIFSNGLAAGGREEDERLKKWLYETKNEMGSSNYLALREAVGNAIVYGECGIRLHKGHLYPYEKGHYGILYEKADGITKIAAYFIHEKGDEISGDINRSEWEDWNTIEDIFTWFREKKLILLDTSEFVNLRNDTSKMQGLSPLLQDKQRIALLLAVYERLNYDIRYDGPGRIILRAKSRFESDEPTSTTTEIMNNSAPAVEKRLSDAMTEALLIGKKLRSSSSDQVIVVSDGFEKDITHLPRVTKALDFMEWISSEGVIVAQILGMSSVLVEVGHWSGNVSMEKVIDDAMVNTIVPLRELFAVQFSDLICREVGVAKVYFNKYDMKQAEDQNTARQKVAGIIRDLSYAAKANEKGVNLNPLIEEVSEMLHESLYDDDGNIQTL